MRFSRVLGFDRACVLPQRKHCLLLLLLIALTNAFLASCAVAQRVEKYAVDEEVEVFFLNEWRPGVALEMNRKGDSVAERRRRSR